MIGVMKMLVVDSASWKGHVNSSGRVVTNEMIIEQKSCMENIEAPHLYMGIKLTFLS
jgi:hypothetical protein